MSFKIAHTLRCLRKVDEADRELRKCFQVYSEVVHERIALTERQRVLKKRAEDLVDQDFDDLIAFWFK